MANSFSYNVDQVAFKINVEGKTDWGDNEILVNKEVNLIKTSTFANEGYAVVEFLEAQLLHNLH